MKDTHVGALVMYILERGDKVGDTTKADNAAGKQGHETRNQWS